MTPTPMTAASAVMDGAVAEADPYAVVVLLAALDRAVHDGHAAVGEGLGEGGGEGAGEHLLLHVLEVEHEGDLHVVLHEGGGDLRADVATADDRDVAALGRDGAQPLVVGGGAVVDDPRAGVDGEHAGLGAGGEQQLAVADAAAVGEAYDVRAGVDLGHRGVGDQVDGVVLVEVAGERGPLEGLVVLEPEVLGQDGPVDRLVGLGAEDGDAAGPVLRTDALHGARRSDPRTDDDVVIGLLDVAHVAIVHPRWSGWTPRRSIRGCGAPPSRRRGSWRCRPGSGRRRRCGGAATRGRPCAGTS